MTPPLLRVLGPAEVPARRADPVDAETLIAAAEIQREVRERGEEALRLYAERFGEIPPGLDLIVERDRLDDARDALPRDVREVLERTAARIEDFARAQRGCLSELELRGAGGTMGHRVVPVRTAGCYAPGGRYPYPSSVLMTAIPARVAGVETVVVASPRPSAETLAAASIAGADMLLAAGGVHAVTAMAFGVGALPECDAIVGPGNRWVTAGKQLVAGLVRIDGLAGPSELVVFADDAASPARVAADLIAQAEHDPDAIPILVTPSRALVEAVEGELGRQLEGLATADVARAAFINGYAVLVADLEEGARVSEALAPEHLELIVSRPEAVREQLTCYGALFEGEGAAEVFGDYGAGPNHVLPTGGMARAFSGLAVTTFLKMPTHMRVEGLATPPDLLEDAVALARIEGLEGHARAAELRRAKKH